MDTLGIWEYCNFLLKILKSRKNFSREQSVRLSVSLRECGEWKNSDGDPGFQHKTRTIAKPRKESQEAGDHIF